MKFKIRSARRWIGPTIVEGSIPVVDGWLAFDTETTGLDPHGTMGVDRQHEPSRPFLVQVSNADGDVVVFRFRVDAYTRLVSMEDAAQAEWLRQVLADPNITKVKFNANFDLRMLEFMGYEINGEVHDVLHMCHALNPGSPSQQLKWLAKVHCGFDKDDETALVKATQSARGQVGYAKRRIGTDKERPDDAALAKTAIFTPPVDEYSDKKKTDKNASKADFWLAPHELASEYGGYDALRTAMLFETATAGLDQDAEDGGMLWEIYREEQALREVVKAMEDRGIAMDREQTQKLCEFYHDMMVEHKTAAMALKKYPDFDIDSGVTLQIEFFRYQELAHHGWVMNKKTKKPSRCVHCQGAGCDVCRGTGHNPKVDNDFLAFHGAEKVDEKTLKPKDQLCWHVLHYKGARAMLSFVKEYMQRMVRVDGSWRMHTNFKQVGTQTGRMSCEKPNLQNVADDDSGKKRSMVPYLTRTVFVPSMNRVLYAPDYSQIEVWMLAIRAQAKSLMDILCQGGDTHGRVCALIWGHEFDLEEALKAKELPPDSLKKHELENLKIFNNRRKRSKNLQFCKIYGGGAAKIAFMIGGGCTVPQAKKFIADYNRALPEVAEFMDRTVRLAQQQGWIANVFGRKYIIDPNRAYVATNYDIQGSAADLIKRAMIRCYEDICLQSNGLIDLILQVHDELVFDVDLSVHNKDTMRSISTAMQADYKMLGCPKPFPVEMKVCTENWAKGEKVKL